MGGVEDDEPPTKRVKVSLGGKRGLANNSSHSEPAIGSLYNSMARPLPSDGGDEEMVGSKGIIKKMEFVRIITEALYSLGYEKSGSLLEEESGIPLHSSLVGLLRKQVLNGNWEESVVTLQKIGILEENTLKSASFLILEQKFFELLGRERVIEALQTLRTEITPLSINVNRVHELASCVVYYSQPKLVGSSNGEVVSGKSRSKLLEELQKLPSNVQRGSCVFHNSLDSALSLFSDHQCGKDQIPSRTSQVLESHNDEVWFLLFSHDGKYLASSSNDRSAIIWEVNGDGVVTLKHKLTGHQRPIMSISWSPDSHQILTCGLEDVIRLWDVNSGECLQVYEKSGLSFVSCEWHPDGNRIFTGLIDKSICMWDLDGNELECWKGQRTLKISDMAVTSDGEKIITICRETSILILDRVAKVEKLIEEDQVITSFSLSRDNKYLLVDLFNQEVHLWSLEGDFKLVSKYKGHKRSRFIIRSCFGGFEQGFIASGSEDSQVYIWHRGTGELLEKLPGHSGSVNCVSWNPKNPHMLASASDDRTIRIWGLNSVNLKRKEKQENGVVHHCNGRA
ncbi:hypothetical protein MKW92_014303 [Papaver armeniacum]|nr:hypothetical protein MKW92_014303 [Papaver armeniacum]